MITAMDVGPARRGVAVLVGLALIGVLATVLSVARPWGALALIVVVVWFCHSGVAVARRAFHSEAGRAHWLIGPVWGLALSLVGLLVLWLLGARSPWALAVAPWPAWLLARLPLERAGLDLRLPRLDRRDVVALALLVLLVPAVVASPYGHVAEPVDDGGQAYRAYFTADFVWAMAVVAEVSKGDLPPKNPFQIGGTLHYYWLAHFLSAAEYRMFGPWGLSIEEVLLANSVGYCLIFVVFLYGLVRAFGVTAAPAAAGCALVFLANSFEALDRMVIWWGRDALLDQLTRVNLDAVTRWFYGGMPVDGLHRMFLYQPHHLAGYAVGLTALMVIGRAANPGRPLVALAAGTCLAGSLLLSSFEAIMIGVAVTTVYGCRLLSTPSRWRAIPACAVAGALPVALAVYASERLAYVDPAAATLVTFGLNPIAAEGWQYALLLSFGPMLILGAIGLIVAMTGRRWETLPMAALAGVAVGFYFFADVPDMQHVWVGWRAGHLLFIACALFAAVLLSSISQLPRAVRVAAWTAVGLLALASVPTVVLDVFNAQDITNRAPGPGFPWTLVLSRGEVEALDWIKTRTPPDVVVQTNVQERSTASWGYMPAFGERRMAAGLPIAMIPMQPYLDATERVGRDIFGQVDVEARLAAAKAMGIDYLYLGPAEQERHADLVPSFDSRSDLFPVAFRNPEVVIYWVPR